MTTRLPTKVGEEFFAVLVASDLQAGINLDRDSMKTVYEKFGLEAGTQDFIGHAMALYLDDECVTLIIDYRETLF